MKRSVFLSDNCQNELESKGYVRLKLFNCSQIEEFQSFYESEIRGFGNGDFLHTHMAPEDVKLKVHEFVKTKMELALEQILVDYKVGLGYFLIKPRNGTEPMRVHQDKTLVDESKYVGLTVWCPLVDVDSSNGCLSVVRRSHLFLDNPRGSGIDMPYKGIEDFVEGADYSDLMTVGAGEAIIFDHRLWHASTANRTDQDRVVMAAVATPRESQYMHYELAESGDSLNLYHAEDDFPIRFDIDSELPDDCELLTRDVPLFPKLSQSEFEKLYYKFNPKQDKSSFWRSLLDRVITN